MHFPEQGKAYEAVLVSLTPSPSLTPALTPTEPRMFGPKSAASGAETMTPPPWLNGRVEDLQSSNDLCYTLSAEHSALAHIKNPGVPPTHEDYELAA
ncbi:hypothetical protein TWF694_005709 [Orbilia ellipsospora]|uniref:Uncharacterized protein n=1 Tax=Orbilia ellipsospora TaxID=2528407 RepID=A0AAV9WXT3_9PEZI